MGRADETSPSRDRTNLVLKEKSLVAVGHVEAVQDTGRPKLDTPSTPIR
jgi:hypothetical protein